MIVQCFRGCLKSKDSLFFIIFIFVISLKFSNLELKIRVMAKLESESVFGQSKSNKGTTSSAILIKRNRKKWWWILPYSLLHLMCSNCTEKMKVQEKNCLNHKKQPFTYAFLSFLPHRSINVQNLKILLEKTCLVLLDNKKRTVSFWDSPVFF